MIKKELLIKIAVFIGLLVLKTVFFWYVWNNIQTEVIGFSEITLLQSFVVFFCIDIIRLK